MRRELQPPRRDIRKKSAAAFASLFALDVTAEVQPPPSWRSAAVGVIVGTGICAAGDTASGKA